MSVVYVACGVAMMCCFQVGLVAFIIAARLQGKN